MVHCERCGTQIIAASGSFEYCVACGLFVCLGCWYRTGFCASCAPSLSRHTVARDTNLLRRVDRRLRETARDALAVADPARLGQAGRRDLSIEIVCLELKSASAVAVRDSVLRGRMSARPATRLVPLSDRIRRHISQSQAAIGQAAAALVLEPPGSPLIRAGAAVGHAVQALHPSPVYIRSLAAAAVAAVVVMFAAYVASGWPLPSEGVLGGVPGGNPAAGTLGGPLESPSTPGAPAEIAPASPSSLTSLEVEFDDQRIGAITDPRWDEPSTGMRIAAFPTSFDRSVEISTAAGQDSWACLSPTDAPVALHSLSLDFVLDEAQNTAATIGLRREDDTPLLDIRLAAQESSITAAADVRSASAESIVPETWYRVEMRPSSGETLVAISPASGGPATELRVPRHGPSAIGAVCLGVSGAADASVHYDNIQLEYERSSG